MFYGGELPEEDKDEFFRAITDIHFNTKEKTKNELLKSIEKTIRRRMGMSNEEKLFSLLEKIYNELQETRAETNARLNTLEQGQSETNMRLNTLEQGQSETNMRLNTLEQGQSETNVRLNTLEQGQSETNVRLNTLEQGQSEIKKDLKAIHDQTADLTEFRTETRRGISDIKDTLRFVLHKEIETEKEIFKLKERIAQNE
jgi:chromosome segregation ATPase